MASDESPAALLAARKAISSKPRPASRKKAIVQERRCPLCVFQGRPDVAIYSLGTVQRTQKFQIDVCACGNLYVSRIFGKF